MLLESDGSLTGKACTACSHDGSFRAPEASAFRALYVVGACGKPVISNLRCMGPGLCPRA